MQWPPEVHTDIPILFLIVVIIAYELGVNIKVSTWAHYIWGIYPLYRQLDPDFYPLNGLYSEICLIYSLLCNFFGRYG